MRREARAIPAAAPSPKPHYRPRIVTIRAADLSAGELARQLRLHRPAVVGRISGGRFTLDVRTLRDGDLPEIAGALTSVLAEAASA